MAKKESYEDMLVNLQGILDKMEKTGIVKIK